MSKTLTILGCGYVGTALAKYAKSQGWLVSALTRNPQTAEELEREGIDKIIVSYLDSDEWHEHLNPEQDFVVNCVGAASFTEEGYVKSYIEGQKSAMNWAKLGRVGTFVFTSSCSVYPQTGRKLVDESASSAGVSEKGGLLLAAESVSFPSPATIDRSFILRLGGIYGPDRHLLVEKIKAQEKMEGNSSRILNLIHREDAVSAIVACLLADEKNLGRIYNLTDGSPVQRGQIIEWLSQKMDLPAIEFMENDSEETPNRKISNQRIQNELSWSPTFPSFIQGYESLLT